MDEPTPVAAPTPETATPTPETTATPTPETRTTPSTTTTDTPATARTETSAPDKSGEIYRQKADLFDSLTRDADFRRWYSDRTSGSRTQEKKAEEPALTDDELQALWADPKKYNQYLEQRIERKAQELLIPAMDKANREIELLKRTREIESTANIHSDFWALDEKGLIEKVMTRYPNLSAEDAYWLAKREIMEQDAITKAHQTIEKKRGLVVEKPGVTVNGAKIVKVKNKGELMEKAYEYAKRGEEPPEFEIG